MGLVFSSYLPSRTAGGGHHVVCQSCSLLFFYNILGDAGAFKLVIRSY